MIQTHSHHSMKHTNSAADALSVGILNCTVKLPVNTQTRKRTKRSFFICLIILNCLKKTDHALLNQVICLSPDQEHGSCLFADKFFIFFHQVIRDFRLSFSQPDNQFLITVLVITAHISFPFIYLLLPVAVLQSHMQGPLLPQKHSENLYHLSLVWMQ